MKKVKRLIAVIVMGVMVAMTAFALIGCMSVRVGGSFTLNADGTGSRTLVIKVHDEDAEDGYGNAYKFLKKHGEELEEYIVDAFSEKIDGSEEWLTVAVTESLTETVPSVTIAKTEIITLSFNFSSFNDYVDKMAKLTKFGAASLATGYVAPTLTAVDKARVDDVADVFVFEESNATTLAAVRPIFEHIMNDDAMFDIDADGTNSQPDDFGFGTSDFAGLKANGLDSKEQKVTVKLGNNEAKEVAAEGGINIRFSMSGAAFVYSEPTDLQFHYDFDSKLTNSGTLGAEGDLVLGEGSSMTTATYADGINGKGIKLDGSSYLASPASRFGFETMTISFYFKPDKWVDSDNGANMVIGNQGLGALAGGALDVGFFQDRNAENKPIVFNGKVNSPSDWQSQDKIATTSFFNNRLNEWHNYVIVYGTNRPETYENGYISLYIDGVHIRTTGQYNNAGGKIYLGSVDDKSTLDPEDDVYEGFNIGAWFYDAQGVERGISGVLDEFRIYSGSLAASEVTTLYNTNKVSAPYDKDHVTNTDLTPAPAKKGCFGAIDFANTSVGKIAVLLTSIAALAFILIKTMRRKTHSKA